MKLLCIVTLVHSSALISVLFTFIGLHSSRSCVLLIVVLNISQLTDVLLIVVFVITVGIMVTVVTFISVTFDVTLLVAEIFMEVTFISVEPTLVSVDVLKIVDVL